MNDKKNTLKPNLVILLKKNIYNYSETTASIIYF